MNAARRLDNLSLMDKGQLTALWKQLFDNNLGSRLRRNLLIRILAYRIQEQEYGGLSKATLGRLHQLGRLFEVNPKAEIPSTPALKPGTRVVREWKGRMHHVTVIERGYEYSGRKYASLSQIARLITGTRWNGPLFFGLRSCRSERDDARRR